MATKIEYIRDEFTRTQYLITLGAVGSRSFLVDADDFCDAIDIVAEYCAERGWYGFAIPLDDYTHDEADEFEYHFTESGWIDMNELWATADPERSRLIECFADKPVKPLRGIGKLGY